MSSRLISHSPPLSLATKIDSAELPTISPSIRPSWMREIVDVVEQPRHKSIPNPNPANRLESPVQLEKTIARSIIWEPGHRRQRLGKDTGAVVRTTRSGPSLMHPLVLFVDDHRHRVHRVRLFPDAVDQQAAARGRERRLAVSMEIGAIVGSTAHLQLRRRSFERLVWSKVASAGDAEVNPVAVR